MHHGGVVPACGGAQFGDAVLAGPSGQRIEQQLAGAMAALRGPHTHHLKTQRRLVAAKFALQHARQDIANQVFAMANGELGM